MTALGGFAKDRRHLLGIALVLAAGLCFSLYGPLFRLVDAADGWQILVYRSASLALTMALVLVVRYRGGVIGGVAAAGWRGVAGGLCVTLSSVCAIWALFHITVANVVFLFGAAPFLASILAMLFLGERVHLASWATMAAALAGIAIIVMGGLGAGQLFGNALAVLGTFGFAGLSVALRSGRDRDMTPVFLFAGLFTGLVALGMADSLAITAHDLGICVLMGTVHFALGLMLFSAGAKYVRAGELTLLSNVEIILGPIWVWMIFGEMGRAATLVGGAVVILAISGQALISARYPEER